MTTLRQRLGRQAALDNLARLDSMVVLLTDQDRWNRQYRAVALAIADQAERLAPDDQEGQTRVAAGLYRLSQRTMVFRRRREHYFRHLCGRLFVEAHVGPDALVNRQEYLGPLWDRLEAIPEDYAAWQRDFDEQVGAVDAAAFRAVCEKYAVPEIADLRETDPEEFERRMEVGRRHASREPPKGDG